MSATNRDYTKTWIPGPSRVSQTFNAPGNVTIPYGRFQATVTGKGAPGNSPQATAWATNYNVVYPIANQPIANQPATGWTTNYNVAYPVSYPVSQTHYGGDNPPTAQAVGYTTRTSYWTRPANSQTYYGVGYTGNWNSWEQCGFGPNVEYWTGQGYLGAWWEQHYVMQLDQCQIFPGHAFYVTFYNTVYNTVYPVANRPATAWTTNYNTNYNVVYPIANQPATAYVLGNIGQAASALGVTAPGGPVSQAASPISPTAVAYYSYPDNATYPVTVPSGGQINITIT